MTGGVYKTQERNRRGVDLSYLNCFVSHQLLVSFNDPVLPICGVTQRTRDHNHTVQVLYRAQILNKIGGFPGSGFGRTIGFTEPEKVYGTKETVNRARVVGRR